MKKMIPVVALAIFATMFTSCKKDYTCTCTISSGGTSVSQAYSLGKQTKKDADKACTNYQTAGAGTITCHL